LFSGYVTAAVPSFHCPLKDTFSGIFKNCDCLGRRCLAESITATMIEPVVDFIKSKGKHVLQLPIISMSVLSFGRDVHTLNIWGLVVDGQHLGQAAGTLQWRA
jgi:hypothetical protein